MFHEYLNGIKNIKQNCTNMCTRRINLNWIFSQSIYFLLKQEHVCIYKKCSKDRVPSFCPSLALKETRAVLDRFPQLGCVKTWIWRRRNPYYAASGIVLASGGPVFIKRHSSSVRNAHALMQEHRFIAHLRAAQLPVCEVLVDASGACAIDCGHWVYEVHRAMPGIDLYRDAFFWTPFVSVAHARAAGQALAQLHLAARGYTAPARRTQILVGRFGIFASADPLAQLDALIRNCPSLARADR